MIWWFLGLIFWPFFTVLEWLWPVNGFEAQVKEVVEKETAAQQMAAQQMADRNMLLIDLQQKLMELKKNLAIAITDEKRSRKIMENERSGAREWRGKARLADKADNDKLQEKALARAAKHDDAAKEHEQLYERQKAVVEKLKDSHQKLHNHIEILKFKQQHAKAEEAAENAERLAKEVEEQLDL